MAFIFRTYAIKIMMEMNLLNNEGLFIPKNSVAIMHMRRLETANVWRAEIKINGPRNSSFIRNLSDKDVERLVKFPHERHP